MLDRAARRYLNMDAHQFVTAWDTGAIEDADRPEVMRVTVLLPFVRE